MNSLEERLRADRDAGKKLLVPYVTGGLPGWADVVSAVGQCGANACEIGIPFSDPVMDGPTIQAASEIALAGGATPPSILDETRSIDAGIPLAVMTYYNLVHHETADRFAAALDRAGVRGAILPDLPLEEVGPWAEAADRHDIATILLAAPTAPDDRLPKICERSRGFVYGVGLLGVTGERAELAESAVEIARRLKAITDLPVLVGVGVSSPEQAVRVCEVADGVVVGSALIARLLAGANADEAGTYMATFRHALDAG